MTEYKIKTLTACYTGGGIYIYYGQLENGLYFRSADEWGCIAICTEDTSVEAADFPDFYDKYMIEEIIDNRYNDFMTQFYEIIIDKKPAGNYCITEMETRYQRL